MAHFGSVDEGDARRGIGTKGDRDGDDSLGGRRVTIRGEQMGTAYHLLDVLQFLRRTGLPEAHEGIDDPDLVEWRGGDSRMWPQEP
jgi:hypothetical protein